MSESHRTSESHLTPADRMALEYFDELKARGITLPPYDGQIVSTFTAWLYRNYDVYKMAEVNRG